MSSPQPPATSSWVSALNPWQSWQPRRAADWVRLHGDRAAYAGPTRAHSELCSRPLLIHACL